jgi:tetratricopeptide (TPR) repeat protein
MLYKKSFLTVLAIFLLVCLVSFLDAAGKAKSNEEIFQEKLSKVKDNDAKGFYELGLWCQQNKIEPQAKTMFEKVIEIDPNHSGARGKLGYIKYKNRWIKKGEETKVDYEEKLSKLKEDDAKGVYELGLWCESKKLTKEAQALFEKTIKLDPEHAGARGKLGYIKYKDKWIKKGEEASVDYAEQVAQLKDDDAEGHYKLGA